MNEKIWKKNTSHEHTITPPFHESIEPIVDLVQPYI